MKHDTAAQIGALFVPDGFGYMRRYIKLVRLESGREADSLPAIGLNFRKRVEPNVKIGHKKYLQGTKGKEKVMLLLASSVYSLIKRHPGIAIMSVVVCMYPFVWMAFQFVRMLR